MVPAIRLKTELLPAPLGPIIPRHRPESSENVTSSATTIAPNRFCRPATSRSAGNSAELRQELQLGFDRDLRRRGVVDDQELEREAPVLRLSPLAAGHA